MYIYSQVIDESHNPDTKFDDNGSPGTDDIHAVVNSSSSNLTDIQFFACDNFGHSHLSC
jgi:hypothetical protein